MKLANGMELIALRLDGEDADSVTVVIPFPKTLGGVRSRDEEAVNLAVGLTSLRPVNRVMLAALWRVIEMIGGTVGVYRDGEGVGYRTFQRWGDELAPMVEEIEEAVREVAAARDRGEHIYISRQEILGFSDTRLNALAFLAIGGQVDWRTFHECEGGHLGGGWVEVAPNTIGWKHDLSKDPKSAIPWAPSRESRFARSAVGAYLNLTRWEADRPHWETLPEGGYFAARIGNAPKVYGESGPHALTRALVLLAVEEGKVPGSILIPPPDDERD